MNQTLLILDGDGADWGPGCLPDAQLRDCFLRDTLDLAGRLPSTRSLVISPDAVQAAATAALANGPVVLITADVPHLPIWRLRDAFTHLHAGARLVVGPDQHGGWYMLGLAPQAQELVAALPLSAPGSDDLSAALSQSRAVALSAWYRLAAPADLRRLASDLAPMPADIAAHTRARLADDGLSSRAVGG